MIRTTLLRGIERSKKLYGYNWGGLKMVELNKWLFGLLSGLSTLGLAVLFLIYLVLIDAIRIG